MKNMLSIVKKELYRVFKDRRMLIMLILPGVLIFVIYTLLGNAIHSSVNKDAAKMQAHTFVVYEVNMPAEFEGTGGVSGMGALPYTFLIKDIYTDTDFTVPVTSGDLFDSSGNVKPVLPDELNTLLLSGGADLVLIFTDNFMGELGADPSPAVGVFYNGDQTFSAFGKTLIDTVNNNFIYSSSAISVSAGGAASAKKDISLILPMLLIALLFSACMAVTPESIAGEKERGTIATILATPVKRRDIAVGKIVALSALASISATVSFLAVILSLPKIIGGSMGSIFSVLGAGNILLLFLIMITTVLLSVGVMALISSFSKSVKEATMMITPFMLVSMVVGLLNIFVGTPASFVYYLIPIYNTVASVGSILSSTVNAANLAVTVISNIVYVGAVVYFMTKIFNSERIMFSK